MKREIFFSFESIESRWFGELFAADEVVPLAIRNGEPSPDVEFEKQSPLIRSVIDRFVRVEHIGREGVQEIGRTHGKVRAVSVKPLATILMRKDSNLRTVRIDHGNRWILIDLFTQIEIDLESVRNDIRFHVATDLRHVVRPDAPRRFEIEIVFLKLPDIKRLVARPSQHRYVIDPRALIDAPVFSSDDSYTFAQTPTTIVRELSDSLQLVLVIYRAVENDQTVARRIEVFELLKIV